MTKNLNDLNLDNKRVLITGGTGSFGQAFVQSLLDNNPPKTLVVLSRDELKQYEMQNRLSSHPNFKCLRFFIGDVRDRHRMEMAMREVDYVIQHGSRIIPVEVKAGKTGRLKSLQVFIQEKGCDLALRFNADVPSLVDAQAATLGKKAKGYQLVSLPFYMIGQTDRLIKEALQ